MLKLFEKGKSAEMSLPKSKTIHGIEIKKMPVGQYIKAMRELEELPQVIVKDLFPGKSAAEILATFTHADQDTVIGLIGRMLVVLPEHLIKALCLIMDVDPEKVINSLTPMELTEVVTEFWKLNDMTAFFGIVSGLFKEKLPTLIDGFKNGSQSPKQ